MLSISWLMLGACVLSAAFDPPPTIHYTINRRGGAFQEDQLANLPFLAEQLATTEARFDLTRREVAGNKVVRVPKDTGVGDAENGRLQADVGRTGNWFATLKIGDPIQDVELDLDMLTNDFYIFTTSSPHGSRFDELFSRTYKKSNEHPLPSCSKAKDNILLPTLNTSYQVTFAHCRPSKSSSATLRKSGALLGLAPAARLSQTKTVPLPQRLFEDKIIDRSVWSLLLINGQDGVLSIGGTAAEVVAQVEEQTRMQLDKADALGKGQQMAEAGKETFQKRDVVAEVGEREVTWKRGWKWTPVEGAEGWWQILMRGFWVNGVKVIQNQPTIIDLNTPFILAPPFAAKTFYASVPGSRRLPQPHSAFYTFPCLNPPSLHLEFGGWNFPVFRGYKGSNSLEQPGGKLSLGRINGSGYCVGAVVETRMGIADEDGLFGLKVGPGKGGRKIKNGGEGGLAGNGLRDVWVMGEPAFRGLGVVFDFKSKEVGFRTY